MKNYKITGWNDFGEYRTMTLMAHNKAEAILIAQENGLYATGIIAKIFENPIQMAED